MFICVRISLLSYGESLVTGSGQVLVLKLGTQGKRVLWLSASGVLCVLGAGSQLGPSSWVWPGAVADTCPVSV